MQSTNDESAWYGRLLESVLEENGLLVTVLVLLLCAICFLFWKLIWNVWSSAMASKEQEIHRISDERDKYQKLVFDRFLTSEPPKGETNSGEQLMLPDGKDKNETSKEDMK